MATGVRQLGTNRMVGQARYGVAGKPARTSVRASKSWPEGMAKIRLAVTGRLLRRERRRRRAQRTRRRRRRKEEEEAAAAAAAAEVEVEVEEEEEVVVEEVVVVEVVVVEVGLVDEGGH